MLTVGTLLGFLVGRRSAIVAIAQSPWSVVIGAIMVVAGGFARHYDGASLLHQPWIVFRSMLASLVVSASLFLVIYLAAWLRTRGEPGAARPPILQAYRSFLGLFWMTAPIAFLYAIPVELFMAEEDAVAANITALAIVSVWRVALMVRVVNVCYGFHPGAALVLVMIVADAAALVALAVAPIPTIDFMGSIQRTAAEKLITSAAVNVMVLAVYSIPIWILGTMLALHMARAEWPVLTRLPGDRPTRGLIALSIFMVLAWAPILPFTQPEQIRRHRVEALLDDGRIEEALQEMSKHNRTDYPPFWLPPPRSFGRIDEPPLEQVLAAIERSPPAPWVTEVFINKAKRRFSDRMWGDLRHAATDGRLDRNDRNYAINMYYRDAGLLLLLANLDPTLTDAERKEIRQLIADMEAVMAK